MERFFQLKENDTAVRTEMNAGSATFLTLFSICEAIINLIPLNVKRAVSGGQNAPFCRCAMRYYSPTVVLTVADGGRRII